MLECVMHGVHTSMHQISFDTRTCHVLAHPLLGAAHLVFHPIGASSNDNLPAIPQNSTHTEHRTSGLNSTRDQSVGITVEN